MLLNAQVHHVFREANMTADFLAKNGSEGSTMDLSIGNEIPIQL